MKNEPRVFAENKNISKTFEPLPPTTNKTRTKYKKASNMFKYPIWLKQTLVPIFLRLLWTCFVHSNFIKYFGPKIKNSLRTKVVENKNTWASSWKPLVLK